MQLTAKIISYLFHPIFMPLIGLLLIYYTNSSVQEGTHEIYYSRSVLVLSCISAIIIVISLLLLTQGIIESLETKNPKERLVLMSISFVCYTGFYILFFKQPELLHDSIFSSMTGALIAIALTILITTFYRISAHMVGIAGVAGMLYGLNSTTITNDPRVLAAVFVSCGLVFSARLTRKSHSADQLITGTLLGFFSTFLTVSNQFMFTF